MARKLPPIHPGEFLREDMLKPLGMSANALAMALRVPATRIAEIIKERRGISAGTDTDKGLLRHAGREEDGDRG
jgi:addiction module HigA family antidote